MRGESLPVEKLFCWKFFKAEIRCAISGAKLEFCTPTVSVGNLHLSVGKKLQLLPPHLLKTTG